MRLRQVFRLRPESMFWQKFALIATIIGLVADVIALWQAARLVFVVVPGTPQAVEVKSSFLIWLSIAVLYLSSFLTSFVCLIWQGMMPSDDTLFRRAAVALLPLSLVGVAYSYFLARMSGEGFESNLLQVVFVGVPLVVVFSYGFDGILFTIMFFSRFRRTSRGQSS